jgi:hypothetical protein
MFNHNIAIIRLTIVEKQTSHFLIANAKKGRVALGTRPFLAE